MPLDWPLETPELWQPHLGGGLLALIRPLYPHPMSPSSHGSSLISSYRHHRMAGPGAGEVLRDEMFTSCNLSILRRSKLRPRGHWEALE